MTATVTRPHNKPIAQWRSDDGYWAEVWASERFQQDDKRGWWWQIGWGYNDGVYQAGEHELIYTPEWDDTDELALDVLATLASFLSAWQEARQWEDRYPGEFAAENGDLFPRECIPFEPAIDDFAQWSYEHKEDQ